MCRVSFQLRIISLLINTVELPDGEVFYIIKKKQGQQVSIKKTLASLPIDCVWMKMPAWNVKILDERETLFYGGASQQPDSTTGSEWNL